MTYELCDGSSEYLVDLWGGCDENTHFLTAKKHFADKGYYGKFILIARSTNRNFKLYNINIKRRNEHD